VGANPYAPHPAPRILNTPAPPPLMKPTTPPTLTVVERLSKEAMQAAYMRLHTGEEWVENNRLTPYPGFWGCYFPPVPYRAFRLVRNPVVETIGDQSCTHLTRAKETPSNDPGADE
jgi:hypothetical protein